MSLQYKEINLNDIKDLLLKSGSREKQIEVLKFMIECEICAIEQQISIAEESDNAH